MWTALTLKLDLFQHPKLIRTTYRLPDKRWSGFGMWEELHRKVTSPDFSIQIELQHAKQQVWMRLEGALSGHDAEGLAHHLSEALARSRNRLVLDLKKLHWDKPTNLQPLREKLAEYRSRIRVVLPASADVHPGIVALAAAFQAY
jgi:hypothetical protein